jgi:hypothetical protein
MNTPPVLLRNFDSAHPFDRAVSEFHRRSLDSLVRLQRSIEERMEQMFQLLLDASAAHSEGRPPLDQRFLEDRRNDFRYLLENSRDNVAFLLPQIRTLDLKLSLLAELLITDEEELILRSLSVLPGDPALQDPDIQALVMGAFETAYVHEKMRNLIVKVIEQLKAWGQQ